MKLAELLHRWRRPKQPPPEPETRVVPHFVVSVQGAAVGEYRDRDAAEDHARRLAATGQRGVRVTSVARVIPLAQLQREFRDRLVAYHRERREDDRRWLERWRW